MRALPQETDTHSANALEYKSQKRQEISNDLNGAVESYGATLPKGIKSEIINNVERIVDLKMAQLRESYSTMRTKRGEKIMIQDMDDIIPYVRLAMLKELFVQLSKQNIANTSRLAFTISKLEGEIAATQESVGLLHAEFTKASDKSTDALDALTKSEEYRELGKAYQNFGKNSGALRALNKVKNMPKDGDFTKDLDTYIQSVEKEIKAQEETISIMQEILDPNMVQKGPQEVAGLEVLLEINIASLSQDDAISRDLILAGENLVQILISDPTILSQALDSFRAEYTPLINGLTAGIETSRTTVQDIKTESSNIKAADNMAQKKFDEAIQKRIDKLKADKTRLDTNLKTAQGKFQAKVDAIKPLMEKAQTTAQLLGQFKGELKEKEGNKAKQEVSRKKFDSAAKASADKADGMNSEKLELDANQKIRINASNLIVRSDAMKSAKPLLTEDKKKAVMLQPGDIVTPILDKDGNVSTRQDGPREYTFVTLSDGKTQGWIALSDKLRGGYKQEYGDNTFEAGILDTATSYKLNGDNIRLRTGFNTRADTIDVLENRKIDNIQRFVHKIAGDNAPEGSELQWAQVQVTYKGGKKQNGYIAQKFLEPKAA